jgi:hypothetical protein
MTMTEWPIAIEIRVAGRIARKFEVAIKVVGQLFSMQFSIRADGWPVSASMMRWGDA